MNDFWTGAASGSSEPEEPKEWLVRNKGMLLGPFPTKSVVDRLYKGEFALDCHVAPDGSDDFLPIIKVAVFYGHIDKARALKKARKRKKTIMLLGIVSLLVLGGLGGAGYWAFTNGLIGKKPITKAKKGKAVKETDVPDLKLVALVDLDKAQAGLKIRGRKRKVRPRKGRNRKSGPAQVEEGPMGCMLDQAVIFNVVKRSLSKWRVCVQNLYETNPDLVPDKLHLGFTVTNKGRLKDFKVLNRPLRRGAFRNCMFKFFNALSFPSSKGSNCTVDDWPIPLKR